MILYEFAVLIITCNMLPAMEALEKLKENEYYAKGELLVEAYK